uniref:hypothetical protein n=1 Tax=Vibrio cholerae TaxID=666 RepID=UPI001F080915
RWLQLLCLSLVLMRCQPLRRALYFYRGYMVFQSDLNEYCQTYLVKKENVPEPSPWSFLRDTEKTNQSIFEQFMLFDRVSFKVYGENIPLIILINKFGLKGVEALLEQDAINFVLWNHMVTYMVDEIKGVEPLQSGTLTSPAHSDPEESLSLGFGWLAKPLRTSSKKNLIRKTRDKYTILDSNLSAKSVQLAKSSYNSGKLKIYGLDPELSSYIDLNKSGREKLCSCASEILLYSYLMNNNISTYDNFEFYNIFNESVDKINKSKKVLNNYNVLSKVENIPNAASIYNQLENPFDKLIKIRNKNNSKKFRKWLSDNSSTEQDITKSYIDSIVNSKGFFETKKGKLTKSIAMTAIGGAIGGAIAGPGGAVGGAGALKLLEPAADIALDMLDEFVLSGLTKGWTPKMYFDDLGKLQNITKTSR